MDLAIQPDPEREPTPARNQLPALHPSDMEIGANGVPGAGWPLTLDELRASRDRFLSDLYAWIRLQSVDRDPEAELVWINAAPLTMEVMRLFNAWVVIERLRGLDRLPKARSDRNGLFDRLSQGQVPEQSILATATLRGIADDPSWRKVLRTAKYALGNAPIRYKPRRLIRPETDIVTFTVDPLTTAHAHRSDRPVVLSKFDEWLTTGDVTTEAKDRGLNDEARLAVLSLIKGLFARAGAPLTAGLERHLAEFLDLFAGRTRLYLEDLEKRRDDLPRQFWPGTGGILYNRVFARAVQKAGGEVTGHDHSSSSGWWRARERVVNELNSVDRFVTYGEKIADGLRRDLDPALLGRPNRIPEIVALTDTSPSAPCEAPAAQSSRAHEAARTVMYVMNLYAGDSMGLWPVMPDLIAVDWQIRLLRRLRRAGYQVLLKPHPESHCPVPTGFAERLDAEIVGGSCQDAMPQADLLLFDFPGATCLLHALRGRQPIVLVDFPYLELDDDARGLLEQRVALVPGHLDERGRATVDWNLLEDALAIAPQRLDRGFVDAYFPPL